ncbi:MAG TPA: NAD(+)/NADH kinase, partial [Armatimonadota bacterium]|nr:NAD(+)/NADH kinase [Armatimonadota bacterium]
MDETHPCAPPVDLIGIVVNEQKPATVQLGEELHHWLGQRGVTSQIIYLGQESGADFRWRTPEGGAPPRSLFGDALVVLGGDGTLLAASRIAAPARQPMLGVHMGGFGFLAECEPSEIYTCVERLLTGDYRVGERLMLRAVVEAEGRETRSFLALNDAVIAKGTLSRLLHLNAFVGDEFVAAYAADGLIVSTPTGSTGYSLSAGGPLIHPDVDVLMLTPICSHGLNVRTLVLPAASRIQLTVENAEDSEAVVTIDGQIGVPLNPG